MAAGTGASVPEMSGQSVRSLARSRRTRTCWWRARSQGVFRSKDNGKHWEQISPAGSSEIHEVESVAIDPKDPNIIYAGTWHLPWKTVDGGAHWENIKQGIIEDSDVFSIVIDPAQPNIVYASACSGIYKSTDAGMRVQGRRDHQQGPGNSVDGAANPKAEAGSGASRTRSMRARRRGCTGRRTRARRGCG